MSTAPAISYCRLCEAGCGVVVRFDDAGAPVAVDPDPDHPVTRGFLCTKAAALAELVTDPERVVAPLRRAPGAPAGAFEPTRWDTALDEIAGDAARIVRESGPDAVAFYQGNPAAFSWAAAVATAALARVIGTSRFYTAGSIDCAERFVVADLCYGHPLLVTIPDLKRTEMALVLGANPAVSTWAQLTSIPRWRDDAAELRRRGGRLVVVDPRRTETAQAADEHLALRPGSDPDLLLAMVRCILDEGLEDRAFLERHTSGLEATRRAIAPFTVARAAERTGLGADVIVSLARRFAKAKASFAVGHSGLTMTARGSLAEWAVVLLNAVCGRIDRVGGLLFNPGLLDLVKLGDWIFDRAAPLPDDVRPPRRRILDDLPCNGLAEAIESGKVRMLVVVAGNPAVTFPNARRVRAALERVERLVAIDPYRNETTRLAHWLLPPPSMLEREDCVLLNSSFLAEPYAQWTRAVVAPPAGVRDEWWIAREIAKRLPRLPSREPSATWRRRARIAAGRAFAGIVLRTWPTRALRAALFRRGGRSLSWIQRHPHGVRTGDLRAGDLLSRIRTPDRRIALAPAPLLELARDDDARHHHSDPAYPFRLLSRRRRGGMNSWLNRLPSSRRVDPATTLEMHADDADALGIAAGDAVRIESRLGAFEAIAEPSDRAARGLVIAPHSVVTASADGSLGTFNDLIDDGDVDPLTGMPRFNGTAVRVTLSRHFPRQTP